MITKYQKQSLSILFLLLINVLVIKAQEPVVDSLQKNASLIEAPLLQQTAEPEVISESASAADTLSKPKNKSVIDQKVTYNAEDSIVMKRQKNKVYLYNNAIITYGEIELKAAYIEYDQQTNQVYAAGVEDSTGTLVGTPVFKEGSEEFEAKTLEYNFKTKKGYIEEIYTEESEGFLHSALTKKVDDETFNLMDGKYTTCDHKHPHYYLALSKAKVVPGDKIISGYSYLVIEDLPLKVLFIPFGFFPMQKKHKSGILFPKYGEERNYGFKLEEGGYYFAINDNMDLQLTGDIYSKGTWGVNSIYRYKRRYKFETNLAFDYRVDKKGDEGFPDYEEQKVFNFRWSHRQDPKANPTSSFNANVNLSSTSYDQLNGRNMAQRVNNNKSSSISYSKNWPGSPFRFSTNLRHNQNSQSESVNFTLPSVNFTMDRQYPFRGKNRSGQMKWYENIQVSYTSNLDNRINTTDSLMFKPEMFDNMQYGFQHKIPVNTTIKFLKFFNLSPKADYSGVFYPSKIHKYGQAYTTDAGKDDYRIVTDTIDEFNYAHMVTPSMNLSFNPKVYFTYQMTRQSAKVEAVRHVLSPTVSFSYRPDLGSMVDKYYDTYLDKDGKEQEYYIYQNGLYNLPSTPGKAASVNFTLGNNLEMKVRTPEDTANATKKIKLLDVLNFSTSYNLYKDSMKWSVLRATGRTKLFKDKVNLDFNFNFDPYALNDELVRVDEWEYNKSRKLFRLTNFNFNLNMSLRSQSESGSGSGQGQAGGMRGNFGHSNMFGDDPNGEAEQAYEDYMNTLPGYVDFDIPWNLSLRYKFTYTKPKLTSDISQTLRASGNVSLTKNWKIGFSTSYDFEENKLAATTVDIHRDLHCWEMHFNWVPIGNYQSYNFRINVKSSVLQDLKYTKQKSWRDNL